MIIKFMKVPFILSVIILLLAGSIAFNFINKASDQNQKNHNQIQIAHLKDGDTTGLSSIRHAFVRRNPGYDLQFYHQIQALPAENAYRLAFIQQGGGTASLEAEISSKISVGDIVYLNKNKKMVVDSLIDVLVFTVPEPLPNTIPNFIRPDWDENITDTPGGCATATNAYRRILLTWKEEVGAYLYHALNAHRVRIMDSFSHYHPIEGGFDEFYLVQMVLPDAQLITSEQTDLITHPQSVTQVQAKDLLQSTQLQVGDLVYLPRGVVHRGLGGVLTQVITVPGFIPGSEIGVDHHLREINERLSLEEEAALPYNLEASQQAIVK
jgi:hypothetical protein